MSDLSHRDLSAGFGRHGQGDPKCSLGTFCAGIKVPVRRLNVNSAAESINRGIPASFIPKDGHSYGIPVVGPRPSATTLEPRLRPTAGQPSGAIPVLGRAAGPTCYGQVYRREAVSKLSNTRRTCVKTVSRLPHVAGAHFGRASRKSRLFSQCPVSMGIRTRDAWTNRPSAVAFNRHRGILPPMDWTPRPTDFACRCAGQSHLVTVPGVSLTSPGAEPSSPVVGEASTLRSIMSLITLTCYRGFPPIPDRMLL